MNYYFSIFSVYFVLNIFNKIQNKKRKFVSASLNTYPRFTPIFSCKIEKNIYFLFCFPCTFLVIYLYQFVLCTKNNFLEDHILYRNMGTLEYDTLNLFSVNNFIWACFVSEHFPRHQIIYLSSITWKRISNFDYSYVYFFYENVSIKTSSTWNYIKFLEIISSNKLFKI